MGQAIIHTLGYADDAALMDKGDAEGIAIATSRLNNVADGSERDADMKINSDKTKIMHVRAQDPITQTTSEEVEKVCKFICPHLGCGYTFESKRGMLTHAAGAKNSKSKKLSLAEGNHGSDTIRSSGGKVTVRSGTRDCSPLNPPPGRGTPVSR